MSLDNGHIMCECCGERVLNNKSNNRKYCYHCQKEMDKEYVKERMRNIRLVRSREC